MSSFKIISRPFGEIECYVLIRDDKYEFEILSGYGAGLNAWRIPKIIDKSILSKNSINDFYNLFFGYNSNDNIFKIAPDINAGCRLTPFPGRVAYAKFNWNDKEYILKNNVSWAPHALHGFLQNKSWKFISFESDDEKCEAVFSCDWPGAYAGFPFPFRATNKIIFTGESYTVQSTIENIGNMVMPYSEGWHPYYMLDELIDNLELKLPEVNLAELDSTDIPTGKLHKDLRFVSGRKIENEFINDCFCLEKEFLKNEIKSKAHVFLKGKIGTLDIWQNTGLNQYNAIQIYTPPTRKSIAIEPMTAAPNALNHHVELIEIQAGKCITFSFGAKFKRNENNS